MNKITQAKIEYRQASVKEEQMHNDYIDMCNGAFTQQEIDEQWTKCQVDSAEKTRAWNYYNQVWRKEKQDG